MGCGADAAVIDGMIVAALTTLLADSRSGGRGGFLPWALLVVGSAASLAANVGGRAADGDGWVIAAWPSFALIAAYAGRRRSQGGLDAIAEWSPSSAGRLEGGTAPPASVSLTPGLPIKPSTVAWPAGTRWKSNCSASMVRWKLFAPPSVCAFVLSPQLDLGVPGTAGTA